MELLKKLNNYRLRNKISQQNLAKKLKVAYSTVNRWLTRKTTPNDMQKYNIEETLNALTKKQSLNTKTITKEKEYPIRERIKNLKIKEQLAMYEIDINNTIPKNNTPLVIIGDVMDALKKIPSESISCIVTSPPYWNLRDYYIEGQIGRERTPEEYINKLTEISYELLRVLKKDGAYFLNIGDTYIDKGLQLIPQRLAYRMISDVQTIGKNKKKIGWLLRNQIIWHKPNHMPSPVKSRFTNTYEVIYFFSRNDWEKDLYFDIDSLRIPYKSSQENNPDFPKYLGEEEYKKIIPIIEDKNKSTKYNGKFKGNERNIGASPGGRQSITGINYIKKRKVELPREVICDYLRKWRKTRNISAEEIDKILGYKHTAGHWFRKDAGGSLPTPDDWKKLKKILNFDDKYDTQMTEMHYVLQTIDYHPKGKNPGDIWEIKTAKLPNRPHFSVFPEELPRKAILSCCPSDGIALDPFAGSGTTGKVAKELNRKSILIELQSDFVKLIQERCGEISKIFV